MSALEQLARLNAKTQSFTESGGGIAKITPQDIAASLAGLPKLAQEYAYVKYVTLPQAERVVCQRAKYDNGIKRIETRFTDNQTGAYSSLKWALRDHIRAELGQSANTSSTLELAIGLAMKEAIDPMFLRCPKCGGSGRIDQGAKQCGKCKGNGNFTLTDEERASRLKINKSNYSRKWKNEYAKIMRVLGELDEIIARHIRKRLYAE